MHRLASLILAALTLLVADPSIAPCADTYPESIAEALTSEKEGFIIRIDWSSLEQHPVVRTALDLAELHETATVMAPATKLMEELVGQVTELGLDDGIVTEIWLTRGRHGSGVWFRSELDHDDLATALQAADWEIQSSDPAVWLQPLDPDRFSWRLTMLEEAESAVRRKEIESMIDGERKRLVIRDYGWLTVTNGYRLQHGGTTPVAFETVTADDLVFPRAHLLTSGPRDILTFAIDLSQPEQAGPMGDHMDNPDAAARAEIRQRLRSLEASDEAMMAQAGNMVGTVSETDGSLTLDLDVRRADGGDPAETERFLNMLLLGARFAIAPTAPELDRELGNTVILRDRDRVRVTATIADGTLVDTLHDEARRQAEAARLRAELESLDERDPTERSDAD
jgi:hypothetical protein